MTEISHIVELEGEECLSLRQLWEEVFWEDSKKFTDYYFKEKAARNHAFALRIGKDNVSMLYLAPYPMMLRVGEGFAEREIHYIVGVATREQYRHRGYMDKLLREALAFIRKKGQPFAFLMPADPKIYQPYQFAYVYDREIYLLKGNFHKEHFFEEDFPVGIPPTALRAAEYYPDESQSVGFPLAELQLPSAGLPLAELQLPSTGLPSAELSLAEFSLTELPSTDPQATRLQPLKIQPLAKSSPADLAEYASAHLKKNYDVFIRRDAAYFQAMERELNTQEGGIYLLCGEGLSIKGYFFYTEEEGKGEIQEAVLSGKGRECPVYASGRKQPSIMARIADVRAMLSLLRTNTTDVFWSVRVKDDILKQNDGIWNCHIASEKAFISKAEDGGFEKQGGTPAFECSADIGQLTAWIFGYKEGGECFVFPEGADKGAVLCKLKEVKRLARVFINEIV